MKITDHCFAITGLYYVNPWPVNSGFIVGDKITLVIDSGSNYISAQTIYGYSKNVRPQNEIILINTEKHLDHIGGNGYFKEKEVSIYGHALINRTQNEFDSSVKTINSDISNSSRRNNNEGYIAFKNTIIENPSHKIDHDFDIDLGNCSAKIFITPGHTKSNISIYQPNDKVLFCGDCVLPHFMPNLEDGNIDDWYNWLKSLDKIRELDVEIIVPGHGNVIIGRQDIEHEIARISEIITKAIEKNEITT